MSSFDSGFANKIGNAMDTIDGKLNSAIEDKGSEEKPSSSLREAVDEVQGLLAQFMQLSQQPPESKGLITLPRNAEKLVGKALENLEIINAIEDDNPVRKSALTSISEALQMLLDDMNKSSKPSSTSLPSAHA